MIKAFFKAPKTYIWAVLLLILPLQARMHSDIRIFDMQRTVAAMHKQADRMSSATDAGDHMALLLYCSIVVEVLLLLAASTLLSKPAKDAN